MTDVLTSNWVAGVPINMESTMMSTGLQTTPRRRVTQQPSTDDAIRKGLSAHYAIVEERDGYREANDRLVEQMRDLETRLAVAYQRSGHFEHEAKALRVERDHYMRQSVELHAGLINVQTLINDICAKVRFIPTRGDSDPPADGEAEEASARAIAQRFAPEADEGGHGA